MKRLIVQTQDQIFVEYHTSSEAAMRRLSSFEQRFKGRIKSATVSEVVKHVEVKSAPELTLVPYSKVK